MKPARPPLLIFNESKVSSDPLKATYHADKDTPGSYLNIKEFISNDPALKTMFSFNDDEKSFSFYYPWQYIRERFDLIDRIEKCFPVFAQRFVRRPDATGYVFTYATAEAKAIHDQRLRQLQDSSEQLVDEVSQKTAFNKDDVFTSKNLCIGEHHNESAARRFIIENMERFASNGYRTLFLEHLFYESAMQDDLDYFYKSGDMPKGLEAYLRAKAIGESSRDGEYNFVTLVKKARECGLRIIGIDTAQSYDMHDFSIGSGPNDTTRMQGMNYEARRIIAAESGGEKWIALMGAMHICKTAGMPGVADIVPNAVAVDVSYAECSKTTIDYFDQRRKYGRGDDVIISDVRIECKKGESLDLATISCDDVAAAMPVGEIPADYVMKLESLRLNPRDIVKSLLHDRNCDSVDPVAYDDAKWQVSAMSYAASDGTIYSKECLQTTVFNIASITKTFTAATILRLTEDERFAKYFTDGINAPLTAFLPLLKLRYPESEYIQTQLENENNFGEITIANLLNHSSGIGDFDGEDFGKKLAFESPESLAHEPDGKFFTLRRREPRPEYGKYSYSNLGYELLGMIISAVGSHELECHITCGDMMREMVIDRLNLNHTFTPGQMIYDSEDEKVKVATRPDITVSQAYDSNKGAPHPSLVFRRAIATSGIYSTPQDLCQFAEKFFGDEIFTEGGLFEKPETVAARDSIKISTDEKDPNKYYAAGYEAYKEADGTEVKLHGAQTQGYFGWLGYRNDRSACCLTSCCNREIARTRGDILATEWENILKSRIPPLSL